MTQNAFIDSQSFWGAVELLQSLYGLNNSN